MCGFWNCTRFEKSPVVRLLLLFVHSFILIPKSHHSASLNFRILILTQVFTLNSHLSHASYNFIAISFGKTFANDNIIWIIIDKIYYGFWPALSIELWRTVRQWSTPAFNLNVAKEPTQSFQDWPKLNFENKNCWSLSFLMFLKSLYTRFPVGQYLSKSLWPGERIKVEKGLLVISLHSWYFDNWFLSFLIAVFVWNWLLDFCA